MQGKTEFTVEVFQKFCKNQILAQYVLSSSNSTRLRSSSNNVKLSNYTELNGKTKAWFKFKKMHKATAGIDGLLNLLQVEDIKVHNKRMDLDIIYTTKVTRIIDILKRITACWTALSIVEWFNKTKDSALDWKALKDYYDNAGNKNVHDAATIIELLDLHLEYHSRAGGMDKYLNEFKLKIFLRS
jgi:hypothetical protein